MRTYRTTPAAAFLMPTRLLMLWLASGFALGCATARPAQSLAEAEREACIGVPERDRDQSPFEHREDIVSAEPKYSPYSAKLGGFRPVGAVVVFRAKPGMTAEWLQRVLDCDLARNAATGWQLPEMTFCPLAVKGATATVSSTGRGFGVTIRAEDPAALTEVIKRAQALPARK